MYEVGTLAALLVLLSCLLGAASLGMIRLARLGSPRIRFLVLLAALGTAFTVFWAPFAAMAPLPSGEGADGAASVQGGPSFPHPDFENGSNDAPFQNISQDVRSWHSGPDADGLPNTSGVHQTAILVTSSANTTSVTDSQGNGTLALVGPPGQVGMDGPLTGDNSSSFEGLGRTTRSARATISDGIQADVNIFWAFSAALLAAAVAFMALQLTLGRKWMLAKVGARRCRDRKLLSLVSRVANELGVRMPRVYLCKGGPNAFVVGYPVSLVIASSLRSCLSDAELSLAVRHELSHVKNRDLILKPLLQSLRMIFFYNPAVHVIVRRMLDERELEADRRSTGSRSEKLHLMTALVKIHDDSKNDGSSGRPMQSASTLRARGHRGQLSERFDNLFASGRARPLRAFSICLLILFANLSILGVPSALLRASEPSAWSDGFASHAPMSWHSAGAKGMFPHSGLMPVFGSGSAGIPQPQKANLSAILSDPQVYAGEVVLVENITVLSAEKNTLSITDGTGTATVLVERFSDLPGHRSIPAR